MGALQTLLCPILIGRATEQEYVAHWLADPQAAPVTLISGEAGLGKSRLTTQARHLASEQGGLSLLGRCFEPDRSLPYAPLRDLFASQWAALAPVALPEALASQLIKIFPELQSRFPRLQPAPPAPPDQEKHQLFEAILQVCIHLAQQTSGPLLLAVEDLHWSDEASLDGLLYLCRHLGQRPIRLVFTFRKAEALARPAVSRFLAELDRERLAVELSLSAFNPDQISAMLRAIFKLSRPVRRDFVQRLHGSTEGNPFYIEEILKGLAESEGAFDETAWLAALDRQVPRSVYGAVQSRLQSLGPAARQVLSLAAVAGRRFDFTLLQTLTGLAEAELILPIKELIQAQLVVEETEEIFAFRHALTRQAVYGDLLTRERKRLHQTIAHALQQRPTVHDHLEDLSYHFYEAADWPQAWAFGRQAGAHAQALYAPQAAAEHFTRALTAGEKLDTPLPDRAQVYIARAGAYEALGEFDLARADHEAALQLARQMHDSTAEQHSLLSLGMLWASRDYARTGDYFQQALAVARTAADPATLAHSLNRVGNWLANVERPHEALPYHQEARQIFETLADPRGLAETLDLLGTSTIHAGDLLAGADYYGQAIQRFRQLDDRPGLVSALAMLQHSCGSYLNPILIHAPATLGTVLTYGEEAIQLARQTGQRPAESFAMCSLAMGLGPRGGYTRAFGLAQAGFDLVNSLEHRQFLLIAHLTLGALYADLLAWQLAASAFNQALALAQESGSAFWLHVAGSLSALNALEQNQIAQADSLLNTMLTKEALVVPSHEARGAQRFTWYARARLALAQGHTSRALQIVETLQNSTPNLPAYGPAAIPWLALLHGQILLAQGQAAQAELVWRAAADYAYQDGLAAIQWRLQTALAQLYRSQRLPAQMEQEAALARQTIESLAANVPDLQVRAIFQAAALSRLPHTSARRLAKQAFASLTTREREVAAQVAQGRSNKAIATQMVVSERTIEKHIENILQKLNFESRAQIAVWAAEKGLAGEVDEAH